MNHQKTGGGGISLASSGVRAREAERYQNEAERNIREHQNCGGYSRKGLVRRMTDKAPFREGNSYCLIT